MAGGLESLVTIGAIIVGAYFAYVKWVRRAEHNPRLEFSVDISFVGVHQDMWLVELLAHVENKGLVRHSITEFTFDLRGLDPEDPVKQGDSKINEQVEIPHLIKTGSWLPGNWASTFIEPGMMTRYSYTTSVPTTAAFVLLHGKFSYNRPGAYHTADRLIRVPATVIGGPGQVGPAIPGAPAPLRPTPL